MKDEIMAKSGPAGAEQLGEAVAEIIQPVVMAMGKLLENNTAALNQLAATQSAQNERLEALEKQIRLQTPVTVRQVSYLNSAIRDRARELLDRRGCADDRKAVTKLSAGIRRSVLARYGIAAMKEIPRHEYGVALAQIQMWQNALMVRDVAKTARENREGEARNHDEAGKAGAAAEPAEDLDG